jgi:hypothetical protein
MTIVIVFHRESGRFQVSCTCLTIEPGFAFLQEVHVEKLLQKEMAKSERPWLVLLSSLSAATVVLLVLVFWRLEHL